MKKIILLGCLFTLLGLPSIASEYLVCYYGMPDNYYPAFSSTFEIDTINKKLYRILGGKKELIYVKDWSNYHISAEDIPAEVVEKAKSNEKGKILMESFYSDADKYWFDRVSGYIETSNKKSPLVLRGTCKKTSQLVF